jgi:hypothetical protein
VDLYVDSFSTFSSQQGSPDEDVALPQLKDKIAYLYRYGASGDYEA